MQVSTLQQSKSQVSFLACKKSAAQVGESKDEGEELEAQVEEEDIENLVTNIINVISVIHPMMFDTYDLCDLAIGSKISKFSISMLQEICTFYDLDTSFIKAKREKPCKEFYRQLHLPRIKQPSTITLPLSTNVIFVQYVNIQ